MMLATDAAHSRNIKKYATARLPSGPDRLRIWPLLDPAQQVMTTGTSHLVDDWNGACAGRRGA